MPRYFSHIALVVLVPVAALVAACGNNPVSPSTTTTTRTIEYFSGTLPPDAPQFYSFTSSVSGTTDITLISLRPPGVVTETLSDVVALGLGTPAGTGCSVATSVNASPGLIAQLSTATTATTYCVDLRNAGTLTGSADFTIRILHP